MPSTSRAGQDGNFDPPRDQPTPQVRAADGAVTGRSRPASDDDPEQRAPVATDANRPPVDDDAPPAPEPEPEEEVLFRCEAAPSLIQVLPGGAEVKFAGQFFRTRDASIARAMRDLIDNPNLTVLFAEEDIDPLLECPYCDFTSLSYKDLKAHIRGEHKGARIPQLAELV